MLCKFLLKKVPRMEFYSRKHKSFEKIGLLFKKQNEISIDIKVPFYYLWLITLIMYNIHILKYMTFLNLHFVKNFLIMDQGGASIHRINKLSTLKPSLVEISFQVLVIRNRLKFFRLTIN